MSRKGQAEHLERLYKKQTKEQCPLPKELKEKILFYKAIYGKGYSRAIFKTDLPNFTQPTPHYPHGWLALYDDMTEKDLAFFFRLYKQARIKRLKSRGIRIRKYITPNTLRDYEWSELIRKNKDKLTINELAQRWAKKNRAQVREMVLKHLWRKPINSHSVILRPLFQKGRRKNKSFVDFVAANATILTKTALRYDMDNYTKSYLPQRMCSAANRYVKKPY